MVLSGFGAQLSDVSELLKEHFETPFTDAMNRDSTLLQRFKRQSGIGKEVQWKVHYAGNNSAGSYAETASSPTAGKQSYISARSAFTQNWVGYGVTGLAQAATRGQGGYFNDLATEAREALEDLKNTINNQLLANTLGTSTDINGLGVIVANTGTYAGIDRSVYTWFQSYVTANGGTGRPLTIALMQDQLQELEKPARKAKVSAILCPRKHYNDYGNLLLDQRRYINDTKLDGGISVLEFENIPVIPVLNMATGNMFFLDEREWFYYVLQNFETKELAVDGDAQKFITTHYSQLVCKMTGRQGRITDLS